MERAALIPQIYQANTIMLVLTHGLTNNTGYCSQTPCLGMCLSASGTVMLHEMRAGAGGKAMPTHWVFPLMLYFKITLHHWKLWHSLPWNLGIWLQIILTEWFSVCKIQSSLAGCPTASRTISKMNTKNWALRWCLSQLPVDIHQNFQWEQELRIARESRRYVDKGCLFFKMLFIL